MTKLATYTVTAGGGDASIAFTNIPQDYTDLKIIFSGRSTKAGSYTGAGLLTFNSGEAGVMNQKDLYGVGGTSSPGSATSASADFISIGEGSFPSAGNTSGVFGNFELYVKSYTESNYKSWSIDYIACDNSTTSYPIIAAGIYNINSAVTTVTIACSGGNWAQNTTATLYGVRNAAKVMGNSLKATGGDVTFDGTYVIHTFKSSGTFTTPNSLSIDSYLVVGGGGAGGGGYGYENGGGGGAGGYRSITTATYIGPGSYSVAVGAGGTGATQSSGTNGSYSGFLTTSATGGGKGGFYSTSGSSGGSGGGNPGGKAAPAGSGNAGGYSPVEGYNGGAGGGTGANSTGGGGGGASAVGGDGSYNSPGGSGGAGANCGGGAGRVIITWS